MTEDTTTAFVLYDGLTPLDLVGPLQVMSWLQQFEDMFDVHVRATLGDRRPDLVELLVG